MPVLLSPRSCSFVAQIYQKLKKVLVCFKMAQLHDIIKLFGKFIEEASISRRILYVRIVLH